MKRAVFALSLLLFASACETASTSGGPSTASGPPSNAFDLGDWRHATAATTLSQFQRTISARYAVGSLFSAATADLRSNDFACAANSDPASRGDPPAQICRKTITAENCTNTWQVHLFDTRGNGHIARTRALYDRRCGNEGLLGGPG